ncbi:SPOSA6832_05025 [Sporobolomyces salmonicolor]|uniref:Transcription initiation factor IIF subunit beta n=1 Tax=Sporidiobolus salmonicolor TaxID=5005 RepID=A0A0D6ET32_SPOSA|nr:SPOSA6832_05025 [Sporobolomyces salmonicolor]
MSFPTNTLPEEFQEEHGSIDLTDDKPGIANGQDDDGEDEDLDLTRAGQRVWLCKVPRFLMEKWSQVEQEGAILGRVRVYDEKDEKGNPKIAVILNDAPSTSAGPSYLAPPKPDIKGKRPASPGGDGVPTEYKLTMQNTASKNMYVFGERIEDDLETGEEGARKKRRAFALLPFAITLSSFLLIPLAKLGSSVINAGITSMLGTVHHECSLTPSLSSTDAAAAYARILRERQRKAAEPKRTLKRLDVDQATANRLASGMGMGGVKARVGAFINTAKPTSATSSSTARFSRIPKNELLDALFTHFGTAQYWTLRSLNDHVKQPQVYLKEVLGEIATLVKNGPYAGMYALKPEYKGGSGVKSLGAAAGDAGGAGLQQGETKVKPDPDAGASAGVKLEEGLDEDSEDDDDDDDEGMEVVS